MTCVLVTGASGFIGKALLESLKDNYELIGLSRHDPAVDAVTFVQGDFASHSDLEQLDNVSIDAVVHLAAVTGGCDEGDGITANVEGTRRLMRYLIDKGCKKFVMASSTAVCGFEDPEFIPLTFPIADEHPCLDEHGYGVSKFLMEEMRKYYHRQNPMIDVINLRLAAIISRDDFINMVTGEHKRSEWALGSITLMQIEDAIEVIRLAIDAEPLPGVRIMNAVASSISALLPTAELLRDWYGDAVDTSYYESEDTRYASVFEAELVKDEFGFIAEETLNTLVALRG